MGVYSCRGPVSWSSQRQRTVATSIIDAEYIAGTKAAKEAVWIRGFINDLRIPGIHIDSVPLCIDNNSALKLTRNPEFHSRSKHIDVKHHFIREKVEEGAINTQRVDTKDNLADVFTKALPRPTHEGLVNRLNLLSGRDTEKPDCVTGTLAARQTGKADSRGRRKDESKYAPNKAAYQSGEISPLEAQDEEIVGPFGSVTSLRSVSQRESWIPDHVPWR